MERSGVKPGEVRFLALTCSGLRLLYFGHHGYKGGHDTKAQVESDEEEIHLTAGDTDKVPVEADDGNDREHVEEDREGPQRQAPASQQGMEELIKRNDKAWKG